ncbi:MAG: DUF4276 family protein [Thermodesulfobacteriota bacterium]
MSRVLLVVEGQTERAILQQLLAPWLSAKGVFLSPKIVGKPGHKGGARDFSAVLREILALLKQEPTSTVTTFFDYYALPSSWPRAAAPKDKPSPAIPSLIEQGMAEAVGKAMGSSFNPARFIPYIQMYELEALLFAGPKEMADVFENPRLEATFSGIVAASGGCESIDDGATTAPSKRITTHFPPYKKGSGVNAHAPRIVNRIGIDRIRQACPHFNKWIGRLEGIH